MFRWFIGKIAYLSATIGMRIGCLAVRTFPKLVFFSADRLAELGYRCFHAFRRRSIENLRIALGRRLDETAIAATAKQTLRNFLRSCVEAAAAVTYSDEQLRAQIAMVGREHLETALAKGNGVLLLSAHLGNFFLLGCRLSIESYPTSVLVNQPRDGRFAELMDAYRLQARQHTIHARPRREALRELSAGLRQNRIVVVLADEFRRTNNGVEVPFFGRAVISRRGPVTLAMRTGAAIVPACMVRQADDSLKMIIEPELELERSESNLQAIRENTTRMTEWLERTIRRYPEQWNWMNIRWWVETSDHRSGSEQGLRRAV